MELRRLALLHELSRRGTIAAVAEALSYSHSSVSVQLAELEREAGTPLLRRVGRGVELTAAGHRLAEHAACALADDEAVRAEIAGMDDTPHGRVRMTIVQTPAIALLPGTLERLAASAPGVDLDVLQRETGPALEAMRSHEVDLVVGIEYDPLPVGRRRDDDRENLLREDVLVALPHDHPAAQTEDSVHLGDLADEVWASGHRGTGLDAFLRNICHRLGGYDPGVRHRSDDAVVHSALVRSGRCAALLPAMFATSTASPALVTRQIAGARLQRTIFSVTRGSASQAPAILAVRRALRETAAALADTRTDVITTP
ncbi:MAG: LysR family transcriptional regulator [Propionibacteriales bacterium]|nr:LysR family transcriptional regulator [Propionibacteriales bacterium]